MSAENNVAKLEEILERVKLNRIRLANAREEAQKVAVAPAEPEAVLPPPAEPAPVVAEPEPVVAEPEPVVAEPEPVVAEPEPVVAEPEPVVAEPEPVVAEPEPVVAEPEPLVAEPEPVVAEPEPEPETRTFEAPVTSSGPVASMEGEIQTGAWTLDAILRRAHKLGA